MKKHLKPYQLCCILIFTVFLQGCVNPLSLEQVITAFKENNIDIEKEEKIGTIFEESLLLKKPHIYSYKQGRLYIFIYRSSKTPENAITAFKNKTETIDLISHHFYTLKNVLVIYAFSGENTEEFNEIQEALDTLK